MFGREDHLIVYLVGLALGTALVGGFLTWIMARRSGWKAALIVPFAILLVAFGTVWRVGDLGLQLMGHMALLAAPALLGSAIGLAIGVWRR